jgi:hypothetical protein
MATIPTVNLNGTAKGDLLSGVRDILVKLREARDAMAEHSPHPRDYQLKPESYKKATAEFHKNDQIISDLMAYYAEIFHGIEGQGRGGGLRSGEGKIPGIVNRLLREG